MQIAYELNEKDFVEAFRAHQNRNRFRKWGRRLVIALIVFGVIALLRS
jgi:hypothetical protein